MASVIELKDLSVTFGKRAILNSLNGELNGRAIGLLGPNGAGKTTLINTLLGFHRPTAGTARILGHDITAMERYSLVAICRRRFVSQNSFIHFVRCGGTSGIPVDTRWSRSPYALLCVLAKLVRRLDLFALDEAASSSHTRVPA